MRRHDDFAIAAYTPTGTLDQAFADGGKLAVELEGDDRAEDVVVDDQGRLVVAGTVNTETDIGVLRLHDPSIHAGGTTPGCLGEEATLMGTPADEDIFGYPAADVVVADAGADGVDAAAGDDVVCGDDGDDRLGGSTDNDLLFGAAGTDVVVGGDGTDLLIGGSEADHLFGGRRTTFWERATALLRLSAVVLGMTAHAWTRQTTSARVSGCSVSCTPQR